MLVPPAACTAPNGPQGKGAKLSSTLVGPTDPEQRAQIHTSEYCYCYCFCYCARLHTPKQMRRMLLPLHICISLQQTSQQYQETAASIVRLQKMGLVLCYCYCLKRARARCKRSPSRGPLPRSSRCFGATSCQLGSHLVCVPEQRAQIVTVSVTVTCYWSCYCYCYC